MAKRIDTAMQLVPTFIREEVEHDLARGKRGPFYDAVVPLNDALVERADRIRTLESTIARLHEAREQDRRAIRRAVEAWDSTVLPVANDGCMQEEMEKLRQRLEQP